MFIVRYSNTMEIYSVKVKKKSQRPPLFCVGMYEYTHGVMPGKKKKKDLKLAFSVRRFLWPTQFGKLREILNK